jgi:RNA polymerase sigma factor (sigma-70 family)
MSHTKLYELIKQIQLSQSTDGEQLEKVQKAFNQLYQEYDKRISNFVFNRCLKKYRIKNQHDIYDLLQETYFRVYKHMSTFKLIEIKEDELENKFLAWTFRIVNNQIIDFLRKRKGAVFVSVLKLQDRDGKEDTKEIIENQLKSYLGHGISGEKMIELDKDVEREFNWAIDNILSAKEAKVLRAVMFIKPEKLPEGALQQLMEQFGYPTQEAFWKCRNRGKNKLVEYISKYITRKIDQFVE